MTTIRKAAADLRVGDYFWINRELRRVTDVVVTITTSTMGVMLGA